MRIFNRRRRRGPAIMAMALIAMSLLAAWGWGLIRFAADIPGDVADPSTATDAIVVLTGGSQRVRTGLDLLAENRARKLFVSGVHESVEISRLLEVAGAPETPLHQRVETGYGALDTTGNAIETEEWMRNNGFRSLRLVTASYHMPRSLLEFHHAMPEATIIPHPVFPDHVKQDRWWVWPGTARLIIGEYNKFLVAWAEHQADGLLARAKHAIPS
jgi:uncharacterized SAM-binding protein YcdF (DUF218 family)